jgi:hypothetical protein
VGPELIVQSRAPSSTVTADSVISFTGTDFRLGNLAVNGLCPACRHLDF